MRKNYEVNAPKVLYGRLKYGSNFFCMKLDQYKGLTLLHFCFYLFICLLFLKILFLGFWAETVFISQGLKLFFVFLFFIKITPPLIKVNCATKFFGKSLVQQSIFCFDVLKVFNNWLNQKSFTFPFFDSSIHCHFWLGI